MRRSILDTNWLCKLWQDRAQRPLSHWSREDSRRWAKELIEIRGTNAIVTPVALEFLTGVRPGEADLAQTYLDEFDILDGGKIPREDWERAKKYAQRIPRDGKPRDLGDCLIKAIADRFGRDVDTRDKRFP